ncbi:MAG TPA: selenoneine biosynthesis selenosugar synthase SenB [Fimbriiglobus sp.]|nr:selenoneine biosynthesis selenosugar synthase SenB [Fimbriiglobus sp.]
MPRIGIVTPAPPGSQAGNRVTAERWAELLRALGNPVSVLTEYRDEDIEILVALHAVKSAPSVERFAARHPGRPVVVAITGTDIHRDPSTADYDRHHAIARRTAAVADRIVFLREPTSEERGWLLDAPAWPKCRVIYQSAEPPLFRRQSRAGKFEVCVLGHLRAVKDPFRTAEASRLLPPESRVRVLHVGAAFASEMEARAWQELAENLRYRWYGELPRDDALHLLSGCRLLAMTSRSEGGPSAVSEALACGVPVVSTRISGVTGLLGDGYPGYFPVGGTAELARLLWRCETTPAFYDALKEWCDGRRHLIEPAREMESWRALMDEFL